MKICFLQPKTDAFLNWGFWAGKHWRPDAAFYDQNWNISTIGKAWRDMIYESWWTKVSGNIDSNGMVNFRGFSGDYKITCINNGKKVEKAFRLEKNGIIWL